MAGYEAAALELGEEELQPLAGPAAPRGAGRLGKAALVAVGLGLAAAAVYSSRGAPERLEAAALGAVEGKAEVPETAEQLREEQQLIVERDLGQYISEDSLPLEAQPGHLGASLADAAKSLFQHVVEQSGISAELTTPELDAFKYRFIAKMMDMEDSNRGASVDFVQRARKHIQGAKPVMTEALASAINERDISFTVKMSPWLLDESMDSFESRLIKVPFSISEANKGRLHQGSLPEQGLQAGGKDRLPKNFESAEEWPHCKDVISNPHNQGRCGSCWVFGAMGPLDSRMCIATDGGYQGALSRGFGASCGAQPADHNGCEGGWPHFIWEYIEANPGVPSTGCVPYFAGTDFAHHWEQSMGAPACSEASVCDSKYGRAIEQDWYKPSGVGDYQLVQMPGSSGIEQMKREMLQNGPVAYVIYANQPFMAYDGGVFSSGCEWFRSHMPNHAVQATGWGYDTKAKKDYIMSLNSWGTEWGGLGGHFKVVHCCVFMYFIPGAIKNTNYPPVLPSKQEAAQAQ